MRRLAVGAWLCLLAPGVWAAERTTASFIPADAFLVVYYDGGHPGLKETTLARFFQEPEVRAALKQFEPLGKWVESKFDEGAGIDLATPLMAASGCELVFAGVKAGDGKSGAPLFVARVGLGGAPARIETERLFKLAAGKLPPGSVQQAAIGEAKAMTFKGQNGKEAHAALEGPFLVVSTDQAALIRALDPALPRAALPTGEEHAVLGVHYAHAALMEVLGDQVDPEVRKAFEAIGVNAVRTVELAAIPRKQRLVLRLDIDLADDAKRVGLAKWFVDCPPLDPELLKRVPKAPTLVWLTSADLPGLWDAVWAVAGSLDARGADQAGKALAGIEGMAGLKLREGLLAPLGRGTVLVAKQDGPSFYSVVLQRVRDAKALDQALMQLGNRFDVVFAGRLGPFRCSVKSFTYRGHACQYLWLMGNLAAGLPGIVPCYTSLGDVFVFAGNPLDLKSYLDFVEDKAPTILDDAEFKALQAAVPADATSLFYGKWTDLVVSAYNTVAPWVMALQAANEPGLPKAIDLANLPSSRLIRRYSGPAIAYSTFRNGLYRLETQGDGVEFLSPQFAPIGLAAIAGLALPAVGQARTAARRVQDLNNLRQIGMGVAMYHNQFGKDDLYPQSLDEVFGKGLVGDRGVLVSPLDPDPPKLANGMPCSYESCFDKYPKFRFHGDVPPTTAMVWDRKAFQPGKRNVLFFDCHVEMVEEERFGRLLGDLDQLVKRPPKQRPSDF